MVICGARALLCCSTLNLIMKKLGRIVLVCTNVNTSQFLSQPFFYSLDRFSLFHRLFKILYCLKKSQEKRENLMSIQQSLHHKSEAVSFERL